MSTSPSPCGDSTYWFTVIEERDDVQRVKIFLYFFSYAQLFQALGRLTPTEALDRVYRIKRASQQSVLHKNLPPAEYTKVEDVRTRFSSSLTVNNLLPRISGI